MGKNTRDGLTLLFGDLKTFFRLIQTIILGFISNTFISFNVKCPNQVKESYWISRRENKNYFDVSVTHKKLFT